MTYRIEVLKNHVPGKWTVILSFAKRGQKGAEYFSERTLSKALRETVAAIKEYEMQPKQR